MKNISSSNPSNPSNPSRPSSFFDLGNSAESDSSSLPPSPLQSLQSPELLQELKTLVATETRTTAQIIALLEEVERRHLHLDLGYTSLFAFATGYLKYSEPQAQRRISAMRVIRNQPELKAKVESGAIPLTTLNQAARFFHKGDYTPEEKKAVILELEGLSTREIEKKLHPGEQELRFWADEELQADLKHLRDLYPNEPGLAGLIQKAVKLSLQARPAKRSARAAPQSTAPQSAEPERVASEQAAPDHFVTDRSFPTRPDSRVPGAALRRKIFERDVKCTYLHLGKRCGSTFALEVDHIIPWALGGPTTEANLRLLCRAPLLSGSFQRFRTSCKSRGWRVTRGRRPMSRDSGSRSSSSTPITAMVSGTETWVLTENRKI